MLLPCFGCLLVKNATGMQEMAWGKQCVIYVVNINDPVCSFSWWLLTCSMNVRICWRAFKNVTYEGKHMNIASWKVMCLWTQSTLFQRASKQELPHIAILWKVPLDVKFKARCKYIKCSWNPCSCLLCLYWDKQYKRFLQMWLVPAPGLVQERNILISTDFPKCYPGFL